MDSIFYLEDGDRAAFLEKMMQAFGCVHVCLWYYVPQSNCLKGLEGLYQERINNQQSTSYGSLAKQLFDVYRESSNYPHNGLIPGLAFASNNPYMKLELHDFQSRVSTDFQQQFYQEAGIKTIVLMGSSTGEIELGMSDDHPQVDIEMEMKNLIRICFPHLTDPNHPPSSSSSSLRSLSVDSPEYPSLLYSNIPTTSSAAPFVPQPPKETLIGESSLLQEALIRSSAAAAPPITTTPHDQAIQALNQIRNVQFPSLESEEAAMTNAILAVLSSPSTSSSPRQNLPPIERRSRNIPTAFRRYRPNPEPRIAAVAQKHSKFKRAVLFFRNMNLRSRQEFEVQGNRPTATQMHHMISERRRREKLNESFHILRSLLPPGSKKDKASVLSSTTEYLSSLKSQVAELTKRNQMLDLQLNSIKKTEEVSADQAGSSASGERVSVEIAQVSSSSSSSSSETRLLDLRVTVRGGISMLDLVIRVIEFLKGETNVSLSSVESNTRMLGSVAVHAVMMRLRVEGDEFDESGFREGVRRVVDDQASKLTI